MEINVSNINSYIISLKTAEKRRDNMCKLMKKLDVKTWNFFDAIDVVNKFPYWIGCGLSHRELLASAEYPCIIYEDDIDITNWYRSDLILPKNNICYLGISKWGTKNGSSNVGGVSYQKTIQDGILQVKYMVSAHAVYYPDKKSAQVFEKNIVKYMFENLKPMDEWFAMAQNELEVYCLQQPIFYQKCEKNSMWTNFEVGKNDIIL